ncbi:hypothetical protein [uncultured Methanolobus sp.]|uniref:hypothetical protein n=1 Tax=uncultured Methanolobus sp. TaxID=218300 RepID=UPI0029C8D5BF|nr:hypothetical protein [uncultured Methanolobus sp.]
MADKMNLRLCVLLFACITFFTVSQVLAEDSYYNIDIALFPEGYADFDLNVDNNGNLSGILIDLPILVCNNKSDYIPDVNKKIKVTGIPDKQTLEGYIDLENSCGGVEIVQSHNSNEDFMVSFTYENSDWEFHPENYPLDSYYMPILFSFPKIRTEDSILVSTQIILPPNMELISYSPYYVWQHPLNTQSLFYNITAITTTRGNQKTIVLDSHSYLTKDSPSRAVYMPLKFKRELFFQTWFIVLTVLIALALILETFRIYKKETSVLEIVMVIVSFLTIYHQSFVSNKPLGVITLFDWILSIFILWALILVIIYLRISKPLNKNNEKREEIIGIKAKEINQTIIQVLKINAREVVGYFHSHDYLDFKLIDQIEMPISKLNENRFIEILANSDICRLENDKVLITYHEDKILKAHLEAIIGFLEIYRTELIVIKNKIQILTPALVPFEFHKYVRNLLNKRDDEALLKPSFILYSILILNSRNSWKGGKIGMLSNEEYVYLENIIKKDEISNQINIEIKKHIENIEFNMQLLIAEIDQLHDEWQKKYII